MKLATFLATMFLASSATLATTVTVISPTDMSPTALAVYFEGTPTGTNGVLRTYVENGFTLTSQYMYTGNGLSTSRYLDLFGSSVPILWSFNTSVSQIDLMATSNVPGVTLYADAAGTQPLGYFPITVTATGRSMSHYTFESDTPFRSFVLSSTAIPGSSYSVEDLRYTAVPEPSILALIGSIGVIWLGSHRRRRI